MKICLLLVVPCLVSGYYTPYHFSNPGHRYVNPIYPHLYSLSYLGARKSPAVVLNPTLRTTYTKTDIIRQTRDMANSLTATLRALAADPTSGPLIMRILQDKDNVCLNSLDEAIAAIEEGTGLVERSSGDIKALISRANNFQRITEPAAAVREASAILKILAPLVRSIAPTNVAVCQATPDQAFGSLRSLAVMLEEVAESQSIQMSAPVRAELRQSASIVSAVTTFITQLRSTFYRFQNICTSDKQYNMESLTAIGDLMVHLADLSASLGGARTGESIRRGKLFTERLVAEIKKINKMGLGTLDCTRPGDFSAATATLDDLATIIEDVGIENLQRQLGINLNFVFNN